VFGATLTDEMTRVSAARPAVAALWWDARALIVINGSGWEKLDAHAAMSDFTEVAGLENARKGAGDRI